MAVEVKYYKPGQGSLTRWCAGGLLGLLIVFGCHSLSQLLEGWIWFQESVFVVPLFDFHLHRSHAISGLVALVFLFLDYMFVVNQPRAAEFLIETEGELKKVNWPPRHEFMGSSFIVILSVIIISLYLMVVDLLLTQTVNKLILP